MEAGPNVHTEMRRFVEENRIMNIAGRQIPPLVLKFFVDLMDLLQETDPEIYEELLNMPSPCMAIGALSEILVNMPEIVTAEELQMQQLEKIRSLLGGGTRMVN